MLRLPLLFVLALALAACDGSGPQPDPPPPPPASDEIVGGVNLTRLFASPSRDERSAVRDTWAAREAQRPERYAYAEVARGAGAGEATLVVFEGRLLLETGQTVVHHAVARLPSRPAGDARPLPVLFLSPRERETSDAAFFTTNDTPRLRDDVVQILVGWRGGSIRVLNQTFSAPVPELPYDADADDALAAQEALALSPDLPFTVDFERSAWAGRGRGGTVALLAVARSGRPSAVLTWAAPTSLFLSSVRADVRRALRTTSTPRFPGLGSVYRDHIFPIRADSARLASARRELLLRSPLYFSDTLPPTLLVHSQLDSVVPFEQAAELSARLSDPEPFGIGLYTFPEPQEPPSHDATFTAESALRTADGFLAFHLGL